MEGRSLDVDRDTKISPWKKTSLAIGGVGCHNCQPLAVGLDQVRSCCLNAQRARAEGTSLPSPQGQTPGFLVGVVVLASSVIPEYRGCRSPAPSVLGPRTRPHMCCLPLWVLTTSPHKVLSVWRPLVADRCSHVQPSGQPLYVLAQAFLCHSHSRTHTLVAPRSSSVQTAVTPGGS